MFQDVGSLREHIPGFEISYQTRCGTYYIITNYLGYDLSSNRI